MRFLLDQGLPYSTGKTLRAAGWDVVHTVDLGMQRTSDRKIIDYARRENRCCVTYDADFHSIIALENATGPSPIRIRQEGLTGPQVADLILKIYPQIKSALEKGAMISVNENTLRIRLLPVFT